IDHLKVASRTPAFGFKGQESLGIPTIAERLNVRHVLEGSVRKAGDTVRITAQLIDAKTDTHLWSETFDSELTTSNIFAVQDEIAVAIVDQLRPLIGNEMSAPTPAKVVTQSVDAYEIFLKAQGLFHARSSDNIPEIIALYEQAVAIDPEFAEAWAGLSAVHIVAPGWNVATENESFPKALEAANKATEIDPELALPYALRGAIDSELGNIVSAVRQMDDALSRDPLNIQTVYFRAAILLDLGFMNDAEAGFRRCLELDPQYEICRRFLSFVLLFDGDVEEADELFLRGLRVGQLSYVDVFEDYYGAIGDDRALSILLASMVRGESWPINMRFQYQTDRSYGLSEVTAEVRANIGRQGDTVSDLPTVTLEMMVNRDFTAAVLWSPYSVPYRKPQLLDAFLQLQKDVIRDDGILDYWRAHGFPPQCRTIGEDDFQCDRPN
ncbi:MAG: hypothetical protein AAF004_12040, partial [Pseudomonadota bacterium]